MAADQKLRPQGSEQQEGGCGALGECPEARFCPLGAPNGSPPSGEVRTPQPRSLAG